MKSAQPRCVRRRYNARAVAAYCSLWRQSRRASVALFAPPRPPPRNRSYSSGTRKTFSWNGEIFSCWRMLDRKLFGSQRTGKLEHDADAVRLAALVALAVAVARFEQEHRRDDVAALRGAVQDVVQLESLGLAAPRE